MSYEKKDCTMNFRCSKEQKKKILKLSKKSGAINSSEYCLKSCLYGGADNTNQILVGLLTQLDLLLIQLENGTLKRKAFIEEMKKEIDYIWSTLK